MKLATFEVDTSLGSVQRLGVVDGSTFLDVTAGYARILNEEGELRPSEAAEIAAPPDIIEFLRGGEQSLRAANEVAEASFDRGATSPSDAQIRYRSDEVRLLSPLPRPNSIRDFSVFEGHGRKNKPDVWYELPSPYKGNPDTVVSPETEIEWPSYDDRPDFELEIAAVVGKRGQNVSADETEEYIVGYTIFNDFSARDIQSREMQANLGPAKGKDFANGFGPYLVTSDEFDPSAATATVRVNDEKWAEGDVGDMYHTFGDIVEHASHEEPIFPGDVLGSGTIAGCCCYDLDRWIDYGDTIELTVDGLGTLRHRIIASGDSN
jgi:2-keto-4-pentenoate hydratase/2-oxohepta-3-ene-1,7-dioic acid hydratase in catechol pathway